MSDRLSDEQVARLVCPIGPCFHTEHMLAREVLELRAEVATLEADKADMGRTIVELLAEVERLTAERDYWRQTESQRQAAWAAARHE